MYQNPDPTMKLVRYFEERAASQGNQSPILEASKFVGELGIEVESANSQPLIRDGSKVN